MLQRRLREDVARDIPIDPNIIYFKYDKFHNRFLSLHHSHESIVLKNDMNDPDSNGVELYWN
ncbi:MAG: hypothetical protein PHV35_11550 [Mariniphaga sp.]|nr:hypothetical protein [Mariniphaga sp.]